MICYLNFINKNKQYENKDKIQLFALFYLQIYF